MSILTGPKNANLTVLNVLFSLAVMILLLPLTATAQVILAVDDQLKEYWVIEKQVAPEYPGRALVTGKAGCVAVGFIIQSDGSTSEHEVLAHYPSKIFDKSGINAAKRFTYTPSDQNPDKVSVYTLNAFTYTIGNRKKSDSDTHHKLSNACTDAGMKTLKPDVVGGDVSLTEKK